MIVDVHDGNLLACLMPRFFQGNFPEQFAYLTLTCSERHFYIIEAIESLENLNKLGGN